MARSRPEHTRADTGPDPVRGKIAAESRSRRLNPLIPVIVLVLALVIGFVVFIGTRSGPNYQEEQFTPDPVQEAD